MMDSPLLRNSAGVREHSTKPRRDLLEVADRRRKASLRRLVLELLEDRTAPAVFSWTGLGGDNNFLTPLNWVQTSGTNIGSDGVPAAGDSAEFGSLGAGGVVNVPSAVTVDSISFTNAGSIPAYSLGGSGTISLAAGSVMQSGTVNNLITAPLAIAGPATAITFDVAASTTLTMNGVVSGTGALDKVSSGNLVLGAANLYTGATNIVAGKITLASTNGVTGAIPPGFAAYYSFDDASGTTVPNDGGTMGPSANATLERGAAITPSGHSGPGLDLTAVGASIDINSPFPLTSTWTESAWFIGLFQPGGVGSDDWRTLFRGANDHEIILNESSWELGVYDGGFKGSGVTIPASIQNDTTNWHNITAVGSGNTTTFYLDGQVFASVADNPSDTAHTVGAYQGGDQHFSQAIDDVYIYQSALDAGQVAGLIAGGNPPPTNPIPDGSSVNISANATFDMSGFNETIGDLTGAGTVTNSNAATPKLTLGGDNASTTFAGIIGDGISRIAVTKVGSGAFTLLGANTYTGGTSIQQGLVVLAGGDNRLAAAGAVDISATAFFDLDNTNQTVSALTGTGTVVNSPAHQHRSDLDRQPRFGDRNVRRRPRLLRLERLQSLEGRIRQPGPRRRQRLQRRHLDRRRHAERLVRRQSGSRARRPSPRTRLPSPTAQRSTSRRRSP